MKIRYTSPILEAVRYGKDEDGRWYPGAVQRVAQFVKELQPDTQLSDGQICDVLQPTGCWNPPEDADLYLIFGTLADQIQRLQPGDWVVRRENGKYRVVNDVKFHADYEKVED